MILYFKVFVNSRLLFSAWYGIRAVYQISAPFPRLFLVGYIHTLGDVAILTRILGLNQDLFSKGFFGFGLVRDSATDRP